MRNTFLACNRLTSWSLLKDSAKWTRNVWFKLYWQTTSLGYARIGWVIPKAKLSMANERNILKRLIRESFRTHQVKKLSIDILLVASSFNKEKKKELKDNLEQCWDFLCVNC